MKRIILLFTLVVSTHLFSMSGDEISDLLFYRAPQPCTPAFVPAETIVKLEPMETVEGILDEPQNPIALSKVIVKLEEDNRQPLIKLAKRVGAIGLSRKPGRYPCENCGKRFTWTWGVIEHQKYSCPKMDIIKAKFKCTIDQCKHASKRKSDLNRHMQLPHPVKRGPRLSSPFKSTKKALLFSVAHRPVTRMLTRNNTSKIL